MAALDRECGDKTFEAIREEARTVWEEKLSRIEIETPDLEQMKQKQKRKSSRRLLLQL